MKRSTVIRLACALAFLAVALGAFGAHGLKGRLTSLGTAAQWETAALYHFLHAVGLLAMAGLPRVPRGPVISLVVGVVLFSGSLYVLALTGVRALGMVTPFGGVAFLLGWAWLAWKPGGDTETSRIEP